MKLRARLHRMIGVRTKAANISLVFVSMTMQIFVERQSNLGGPCLIVFLRRGALLPTIHWLKCHI